MDTHQHHHFYHHGDEAVLARLDRIDRRLQQLGIFISRQGEIMAGELEALEAQVARNTTVDESVVTLVTGLAAQIIALKNDPVKLQALADQLKSSSDKVVQVVTDNTVAEHSPGAPPVPAEPA